MNAQKLTKISSQAFLCLSILSVGYVALLSLFQPKTTMELVGVVLPNTDAISSIRGIYGGAGLVIAIALVHLLRKNLKMGLAYLGLFWGAYATSRFMTILLDGPLGSFGTQWIIIETLFCVLAVALLWLFKKYVKE